MLLSWVAALHCLGRRAGRLAADSRHGSENGLTSLRDDSASFRDGCSEAGSAAGSIPSSPVLSPVPSVSEAPSLAASQAPSRASLSGARRCRARANGPRRRPLPSR
eukprot:49009-Prymnesium_polylepis.1